MNSKIILALTGVGCAAGGFIGGFFSSGPYYRKKFEMEIQEEVERYVEDRLNNIPKKRHSSISAINLRNNLKKRAINSLGEEHSSIENMKKPNTRKINYDYDSSGRSDIINDDDDIENIFNKDDGIEEELIETPDPEISKKIPPRPKEAPNMKKIEPYVISSETYNEDDEMEKSILFYFLSDGIIYDTNEDSIIEDPDDLLGHNVHTKFGNLSGKDDVVYIRNEKIATDFEVIQTKGSYEDYLLHEQITEE